MNKRERGEEGGYSLVEKSYRNGYERIKEKHAISFLTAHFGHRETMEIEDEIERLIREFPLWKENVLSSLSLFTSDSAEYSAHKNAIIDLEYHDLGNTALAVRDEWEKHSKAEGVSQAVTQNASDQADIWDYIHAVVVEVIDYNKEGTELSESADRHVRSLTFSDQDVIDTGNSVEQRVALNEFNEPVADLDNLELDKYIQQFLESHFASPLFSLFANSQEEKAKWLKNDLEIFIKTKEESLGSMSPQSQKRVGLVKKINPESLYRYVDERLNRYHNDYEAADDIRRRKIIKDVEVWSGRQEIIFAAINLNT